MIYLDNHATTPCDPKVAEAMWPYFTEKFGNAASRSHTFGLEAKRAVEAARVEIAALIGCSPKEIIFTSGATESNNLAVLGAMRAQPDKKHLITVVTEHKAVLDPAKHLEAGGVDVTWLPVDSGGRVTVEQVEAAMRPDTGLVSVMAANNEIGTLQPIQAIGALCRSRGVTFHSDLAQAAGKVPLAVADWLDLGSLSAHKMYGPKGVGVLYVRRGRPKVRLEPILHGGGHERGLRSGTLPVPLIVGMGVAATLAAADVAGDGIEGVRALRDRLWDGIRERIPDVALNGDPDHRLPNNLNVSFRGVEADALMLGLRDVAMSSGSACTSATLEPSYVLRALGVDPELAHASLRFGVGRFNTADQIDTVLDQLQAKVAELRALSPLYEMQSEGRDIDTIRWGE